MKARIAKEKNKDAPDKNTRQITTKYNCIMENNEDANEKQRKVGKRNTRSYRLLAFILYDLLVISDGCPSFLLSGKMRRQLYRCY